MYLAWKYQLGTLFLRLPLKTRPSFYVVIRATRMKVKPFAVVCKAVASSLSCLKTLGIGPTLGIKPATSHSAAKHSTDLDNLPRFFKKSSLFFRSNLCPVQFFFLQHNWSFITIVGFCLQGLHSQLENSNLDPREIERARKGQVSVKKLLAVKYFHFKDTFFIEDE